MMLREHAGRFLRLGIGPLALTLIPLAWAPLADAAAHTTDGIFSPAEWTGPNVNKQFFAPASGGSGNAWLYAEQSGGVLYLAYDYVGNTAPLTPGSFMDVFFQVKNSDYGVHITQGGFTVFEKPVAILSPLKADGSFDFNAAPWKPLTASDPDFARADFHGAVGFGMSPNLPSTPHVFVEFQLNINNSLRGQVGLYDPAPAFWSASAGGGGGGAADAAPSGPHDPPITSAIFTLHQDDTISVVPDLRNGGPIMEDSVAVVTDPPGIAKGFGATSILLNGTTSLSFTIANPNAADTLTGVGFSDTLPSGLVIATPNGLSGSCGGGTITATAGAGVISLTGATLAPSTTCTFTVSVKGVAGGTQTNVTGKVASNESALGNIATASLIVTVTGTTPIPTLGEWGRILMIGVLVGSAAWAMRRRRSA